jgi:hypothetical protein
MSYVGNTMLFYWELQHKLGYVFNRTIPTRREAVATVTLVNKSSEIIGNSYSAANVTSKMAKTKKISGKGNNMSKRTYYQWLCEQVEEWSLARLKARELRKEKEHARLKAYHARLEQEADAQEEARMSSLGFARCKRCSYYTSPEATLEQVSVAALKAASELKCFSAEELLELQALILNTDKRKARKPEEFAKFKQVFVCVEVPCKRCKSMHVKLHTPETVCALQQAKIDLLRENLTLIKFEHDVVA